MHTHKSKQEHSRLQRQKYTARAFRSRLSYTSHAWLFFCIENLVQIVTQSDNTDVFQNESKTEKGRQNKVFKGWIEGKLDGKNKLHKKRCQKRGVEVAKDVWCMFTSCPTVLMPGDGDGEQQLSKALFQFLTPWPYIWDVIERYFSQLLFWQQIMGNTQVFLKFCSIQEIEPRCCSCSCGLIENGFTH